MLVKIEARILIFQGTDLHFPSTSVPPGTFLGSDFIMQVCTLLQTDNHASTPYHSDFLQAGCFSCRPTNSVKALKAKFNYTLVNTKCFTGYSNGVNQRKSVRHSEMSK